MSICNILDSSKVKTLPFLASLWFNKLGIEINLQNPKYEIYMKILMILSFRTHILASTELYMGIVDWITVVLKHYFPMTCFMM